MTNNSVSTSSILKLIALGIAALAKWYNSLSPEDKAKVIELLKSLGSKGIITNATGIIQQLKK
ncbi:hypothetical protein H6B13_03285 [Bacteroides gallinaceum]|uniref:hypothetical protein n=1 Tax=Bacteroides gallinaceum TaxID=1462571 RepID=UPI001956D0A0|nr:hypothetical protein [Bacteroides gallinaceum]MBM6718670.1 hypothetical protein [Bacteroides gallinaceum]